MRPKPVSDADIFQRFLADREADACRCKQCVGLTIEAQMAPRLRAAFPPAGDCPDEIVDALMELDAAFVERAEPFVLPAPERPL